MAKAEPNQSNRIGSELNATLWDLLPAWIACVWLVTKAAWFWDHRPDLQFGWVVLVLCGYMLWEAWGLKPAARYAWTFLTVICLITGFLILAVTQLYWAAFGMNAASICGMAIGVMLIVVANLLYVFGFAGVRQFGFGFAFLLIALPMPSIIQNAVVNGLQHKIASLNVELLSLIGIPANQIGSLIRLPTGTVGVDEACSGIRSLQSAVMATLFIGYFALNKFSFRALLFLGGIAIALIGNLVRSFYLSWVASREGIQAISHVHDTAGWSILAVTAIGVALGAWGLSRLEAPRPNST